MSQKKYILVFTLFISNWYLMNSQSLNSEEIYWQISDEHSIVWDLTKENKLPHKDNIEMAGKKVAAILYYEIDKKRNLTIKKDLIFPQLRIFNKTNEPDWKKYRAYYRKMMTPEFAPSIHFNNKIIVPSVVDSIKIDGMITFYYAPVEGIKVTKTLFPSMEGRFLIEEWIVENIDNQPKNIDFSNFHYQQSEKGYKGKYSVIAESRATANVQLNSNEVYSFSVYFGATLNEEQSVSFDASAAKSSRQSFLKLIQSQLVLKTPSSVLNTLFYFSKIRASESIFESSMGLVHSPGGGNYYVGIWANDQIEYSGPFFPYLGYEAGQMAAFNAYKKFLENIPDTGHIAYAFEVDGNFPMTYLDRGDAAMLAYGTSQYLLARGSLEEAKTLWRLVEWSLEYCEKQKNEFGAVASESDEMEGRIETGSANLSTSCLYYGGLKQAVHIAKALQMPEKAKLYQQRSQEMKQVIENYFGANIEGLNTYKYYDKNKLLRHWICLPLVMGITDRKEQTLEALFGKLWTENGILVEYNPTQDTEKATFWDRATLYALRGAMKVGETNLTFDRLMAYSEKRLIGDHVPYPVEAYPENNMKHLSAESALYCRIFTEGLLGIEPIGFSTFNITPKLPKDWNTLELENVHLCGQSVNLSLKKHKKKLKLQVEHQNGKVIEKTFKKSETLTIDLSKS